MLKYILIWLMMAGCGNNRSVAPNEEALSDMSDMSIWGDGMTGFGASSGGGSDTDTGRPDADADADTDADTDADADADADTDAACIDVAGESCFDLMSTDCGYCIEDGGECYSGWSCEDFGMARTATDSPVVVVHPDHEFNTTEGVQ